MPILLLIEFLFADKLPSNNIDDWFGNENLLLMCWVFLIHIVWAEDCTLRNNLGSLTHGSQVFIKTFLESLGDGVLTVPAVTLSLRRAAGEHKSMFSNPRELSKNFTL